MQTTVRIVTSWKYRNIIFVVLVSLITLLYPTCSYSQDGWINQLKPIDVALNDCCFPIDTGEYYGYNYWIAGDSGYILKSNGATNAWSRLESCTTENLNGIYFFHNGTGFCVGDNGTLIKTECFGNQWNAIPLDLSNNLKDIWFIDDSAAIIVGESGLFLKSVDLGITWTAVGLNTNSNLNKIRQLTRSIIWIAGDDGTAIKSLDGGNNWQPVDTGFDKDFNDVFLHDSNCVYIAGDDGLVIYSANGGETWTDYSVPVNSDLYGIACSDCYSMYVCGDEGTIYSRVSGDTAWQAFLGETGGLNYHAITLKPGINYFLFLADSGNYIDVSVYPPGYSNRQKAGENTCFYDIEFLDPLNGFLAGNVATLLHTTNGGENWYSLHLGDFPGNNHFHQVLDVDFIDVMHGFLLLHTSYYQDYSLILGTSDGGITWTNYYYSTTQRLTCMYFLDSLHGWVGAEHGFVMRTSDGGMTWDPVQPTNQEMNDVEKIFFYSPQDGYIFRDYAEFYVTHDGGQTCTLAMDFGNGDCDFSVIQDSLIWLVNELSGVYKSTDGGNLWTDQLINFSDNNPYKICFIDENEGWITGNRNALWHTTDGGENWILENYYEHGVNFPAMTFIDSHNGWLHAQDGPILHGPGLYARQDEYHRTVSNSLSLYPNPTNSEINLNFNLLIEGNDVLLAVYSITGQQLTKFKINKRSKTIKLDVSGFQPGIYFVALKSGQMIISSEKFVVTR